DGIRDKLVTGVQTCALPISNETGSTAKSRWAGGADVLTNTRNPVLLLRANNLRFGAENLRRTIWQLVWLLPGWRRPRRSELARARSGPSFECMRERANLPVP